MLKLYFVMVAILDFCCMLSREATNTNFIVFGLTWQGLEPMPLFMLPLVTWY